MRDKKDRYSNITRCFHMESKLHKAFNRIPFFLRNKKRVILRGIRKIQYTKNKESISNPLPLLK